MECEKCAEEGFIVDMDLIEDEENYYDPSDYYGTSSFVYKQYVCPKCSHAEPLEFISPDDTDYD